MKPKLLTVAEAAQLKGVTRGAIYTAMAEGRLPHQKVLGRLAVQETDVLAWTPMPHAGRRKGTKLSDVSRARMSLAQKQRWKKQKRQASENEAG